MTYLFNKGQKQIGQVEVAKVVCSYLHLKSILSLCQGAHHDTSIVDQNIYFGDIFLQPVHTSWDAGQAGKVHLLNTHITLGLLPDKYSKHSDIHLCVLSLTWCLQLQAPPWPCPCRAWSPWRPACTCQRRWSCQCQCWLLWSPQSSHPASWSSCTCNSIFISSYLLLRTSHLPPCM